MVVLLDIVWNPLVEKQAINCDKKLKRLIIIYSTNY